MPSALEDEYCLAAKLCYPWGGRAAPERPSALAASRSESSPEVVWSLSGCFLRNFRPLALTRIVDGRWARRCITPAIPCPAQATVTRALVSESRMVMACVWQWLSPPSSFWSATDWIDSIAFDLRCLRQAPPFVLCSNCELRFSTEWSVQSDAIPSGNPLGEAVDDPKSLASRSHRAVVSPTL